MASRFDQRSSSIEIMDDLNCSGEVVFQTLRELEFINRTLGGNAVTISGVRQLLKGNQPDSLHIVDLGCGGGDMLKLLKKKLNLNGSLTGIDANPNIIQYANEHNTDPSISFLTTDILSPEFKKETCDIAVATLFFHHFTDDQLVGILSHLKTQARIGIVINDLHRHPFAYHSIRILTKLFSKSSMVKYDAPLSVLRGFTRKELTNILKKAGIDNYTIRWRWAFRWQVIIRS
jgi:2-polyprenyl-3-methyl-5-hydroxy-6-metoxy-1,4-benzoquinol methylase